jgi:hypothetical protein
MIEDMGNSHFLAKFLACISTRSALYSWVCRVKGLGVFFGIRGIFWWGDPDFF